MKTSFMLFALAMTAGAQTFEVATVKLSPPPVGNTIAINLGALRGGQLYFNNVTLNDLVKFGFELVSNEQLTGPAWMNQTRFDIVALAGSTTAPAALHAMMRNLLTERFKLQVRHEQRILPHLALVLGKNGAKLKAVEIQAEPNVGTQVRGRINHPQMPMSGLVTLLSRFERQTVIDQTGLTGTYEIKLEWSPDQTQESDRPSLFSAVQEQLGLRLESRRAPLDVLVITDASKTPEEN
jgi:uncharacterized protein (TIGR03435 family)